MKNAVKDSLTTASYDDAVGYLAGYSVNNATDPYAVACAKRIIREQVPQMDMHARNLAALTAKASALDALVSVCEEVAACSALDDGYHKNAAARFYAALSAAKAAQVSK